MIILKNHGEKTLKCFRVALAPKRFQTLPSASKSVPSSNIKKLQKNLNFVKLLKSSKQKISSKGRSGLKAARGSLEAHLKSLEVDSKLLNS